MPDGCLEIDNLNKSYGDVQALAGMSFDVRGGELFGFVGSNGAGKTTTMRIALGVLSPDSGEVRWNGQPIDLGIRRRIGYMPEERGLYAKMKVGEQLVYLARLRALSRERATASMLTWTERLGIEARRGDEVQALSLGNQQRVQLAAALVSNPDVLVLDEPFSGLDPVAVDVMSEVLREAARDGVPVLFSSHQLDLVERLCDRVGIARNGKLVASGTVDDLRSEGAVQLSVNVTDAPADWGRSIPGVTIRERSGSTTVFDLSPGVDDQVVLRAALAAGPVRAFGRTQPSLTDLYRNVVHGAA